MRRYSFAGILVAALALFQAVPAEPAAVGFCKVSLPMKNSLCAESW